MLNIIHSGVSIHTQDPVLEEGADRTSCSVRKHLTGGFPCAVMDLSGNLWPLLIPEYSGIKRRGTPFPGLMNPGIPLLVSHYGDKYPLPFYEPYRKKVIATLSSYVL